VQGPDIGRKNRKRVGSLLQQSANEIISGGQARGREENGRPD
jgi:hypothetical protein